MSEKTLSELVQDKLNARGDDQSEIVNEKTRKEIERHISRLMDKHARQLGDKLRKITQEAKAVGQAQNEVFLTEANAYLSRAGVKKRLSGRFFKTDGKVYGGATRKAWAEYIFR
ncbi:MAG: hypothetical protein AAFP81_00885 [Pseudomonadota bacterium]